MNPVYSTKRHYTNRFTLYSTTSQGVTIADRRRFHETIIPFHPFHCCTLLRKTLWEEPVSQYVDISFLEPVDEKIDALLTKESLNTAIRYISDTTDKAVVLPNF